MWLLFLALLSFISVDHITWYLDDVYPILTVVVLCTFKNVVVMGCISHYPHNIPICSVSNANMTIN